MRLVAMLGDDLRSEFQGKITDVIGELMEMMRQEKLMCVGAIGGKGRRDLF